jgi:hypothetical protein
MRRLSRDPALQAFCSYLVSRAFIVGVDSVGLLQLSYEDEPIYHLEQLDRNTRSLEDPLVNLRCGVKIMSTLVAKDGVVASSNGGKHRGGARYWSVLRPGHHIDDIRNAAKAAVGLR